MTQHFVHVGDLSAEKIKSILEDCNNEVLLKKEWEPMSTIAYLTQIKDEINRYKKRNNL